MNLPPEQQELLERRVTTSLSRRESEEEDAGPATRVTVTHGEKDAAQLGPLGLWTKGKYEAPLVPEPSPPRGLSLIHI